jgi:hypothetical protein
MTRVKIQSFLAEKRKGGLSGSSVHGMRTALSKVLQAAVIGTSWNGTRLAASESATVVQERKDCISTRRRLVGCSLPCPSRVTQSS